MRNPFVLLVALVAMLSMCNAAADEGTGTGIIMGTVRDWNGNALDNIMVEVSQEGYYVDSTITGASGSYTMASVPAGVGYKVRFRDWSFENRVATEWYLDASSSVSATAFDVTDGTTLTIDVEMDPPATITGFVHEPDGTPIEGLGVAAYPADAD